MWLVSVAVVFLCVFHLLLGLVNTGVGMLASVKADIWMAHNASPVWSGVFFIITAILGFVCVKKKTTYTIMCFTALSIVSMVVAVVSIQLLRLGLVNHASDGNNYAKDEKDILIIIALIIGGTECLNCVVTALVSCRLRQQVKKTNLNKKEGAFHIQVLGEKEVLVVSENGKKKEKLMPSTM